MTAVDIVFSPRNEPDKSAFVIRFNAKTNDPVEAERQAMEFGERFARGGSNCFFRDAKAEYVA